MKRKGRKNGKTEKCKGPLRETLPLIKTNQYAVASNKLFNNSRSPQETTVSYKNAEERALIANNNWLVEISPRKTPISPDIPRNKDRITFDSRNE